MLVVGVSALMAFVVLHVVVSPSELAACVDGTQDRGHWTGGSGVGGSPAWHPPAQRPTRSWGLEVKANPISYCRDSTRWCRLYGIEQPIGPVITLLR